MEADGTNDSGRAERENSNDRAAPTKTRESATLVWILQKRGREMPLIPRRLGRVRSCPTREPVKVGSPKSFTLCETVSIQQVQSNPEWRSVPKRLIMFSLDRFYSFCLRPFLAFEQGAFRVCLRSLRDRCKREIYSRFSCLFATTVRPSARRTLAPMNKPR